LTSNENQADPLAPCDGPRMNRR